MATAATVNTYVDAAIAAMDAGDWGTALTKLLAAKAALVSVPDSSQGGESLNYDRASIDELISQVKQQQNAASVASGGLRHTGLKLRSPVASEDE